LPGACLALYALSVVPSEPVLREAYDDHLGPYH